MDRVAEFFQRVKASGLEYFSQIKQEPTFESEILDFKRAAKGCGPMQKEDKINLSKALSGFTNNGGGLLIWGVVCEKGEDSIDKVKDLQPITKLNKFLSDLEVHSAQLVDPWTEGLEHYPIRLSENSDDGYIITYVPRGEGPAARATASGEHRYYYRTGNGFEILSHNMLMDRMNRKPLPKLRLNAWIPNCSPAGPGELLFTIILGVENYGRGTAFFPAVRLEGASIIEGRQTRSTSLVPNSALRLKEDDERDVKEAFLFQGNQSQPIYPSSILEFLQGYVTFNRGNGYPTLRFPYHLMSEGYASQGILELTENHFESVPCFVSGHEVTPKTASNDD